MGAKVGMIVKFREKLGGKTFDKNKPSSQPASQSASQPAS